MNNIYYYFETPAFICTFYYYLLSLVAYASFIVVASILHQKYKFPAPHIANISSDYISSLLAGM